MITVKEYIARKIPPRSFLSMPDVVNHILKHDTRQTVYKCHDTLDNDICFKDFVQSLKTPPETPKLFNSCLEAYSPRRRHKEFDADSGDLGLDRPFYQKVFGRWVQMRSSHDWIVWIRIRDKRFKKNRKNKKNRRHYRSIGRQLLEFKGE